MISGTYILSGALLVITAILFAGKNLTAASMTGCLSVVFFFASAGVSAAYLTVSEIFPMETRALCISVFYAVGTGLGGITGPLVFQALIQTGSYGQAELALVLGATMMIIGGIAELILGVKAERQSLENIARPLTAEDADSGPPAATAPAMA
jgi:MFS family permease